MKVNLTTNALLAVIAVCLLLVTAKLYNVGLVLSAYGQSYGLSAGESLPDGRILTPVALYAKHRNGKWYPCPISDGGKLIVEVQR